MDEKWRKKKAQSRRRPAAQCQSCDAMVAKAPEQSRDVEPLLLLLLCCC